MRATHGQQAGGQVAPFLHAPTLGNHYESALPTVVQNLGQRRRDHGRAQWRGHGGALCTEVRPEEGRQRRLQSLCSRHPGQGGQVCSWLQGQVWGGQGQVRRFQVQGQVRRRLRSQEVNSLFIRKLIMNSLSSTLARSLATAVVTAAALGGCSMMCGARKCGACSAVQKCGAAKCKAKCKAKCGACAAKQ